MINLHIFLFLKISGKYAAAIYPPCKFYVPYVYLGGLAFSHNAVSDVLSAQVLSTVECTLSLLLKEYSCGQSVCGSLLHTSHIANA
jgi:hypothetical protein